jgi:multicomponent Na+:H+ antiporter subunit E
VRHISLILALGAFWLLLSGYFTPFLLAMGAASALLVTWYTDRRMNVLDREGHPVHLSLNALTYWPWLIREITTAAWDVTRVILHPRLPISPCLIRVPTSQVTDVGQVIYANSITLTPGTISVEVDDDSILVHALTQAGAEGLKTGDMDRRCTAFEGAR